MGKLRPREEVARPGDSKIFCLPLESKALLKPVLARKRIVGAGRPLKSVIVEIVEKEVS